MNAGLSFCLETAMKTLRLYALFALLLCTTLAEAGAARIKDIATVEGVSGVQVIGYGLVTGLNQTGDSPRSTFTVQSVTSMLKRFGITVPQINLRTQNVAAVMVTATIPTFLKKGARFDVQVSSLGDARSLQGGILLMTPLSSETGMVFGMAQGGLSVGGYDFQASGSRVGKNFASSARVPSGGIVDKDIPGTIVQNGQIRILLRDPDFTTSTRIAAAINRLPGMNNGAQAVDAATVQVQLPDATQVMQTIAQIEALQITSDPTARVVINERTGTIVIGSAVQLLPAVVSHGSLEIQIQTVTSVQPQAPFTIAPPQPVQNATLTAQEGQNPAVVLNGASTVQDMAAALNALNVTPRDLIAIFQALKEAGALQAELIIQ